MSESITIQGKDPLAYLNDQFPVTVGHIPLREYFTALNSATEKLQRENAEFAKYVERLSSSFARDSAEQTKQRDQLRAELLATQAQVEQLRIALEDLIHHGTAYPHPITGEQMQHQSNPQLAIDALSLTPSTALVPIVELLTDIRDTTLDFSSEEKAIKGLKLFGVKEKK